MTVQVVRADAFAWTRQNIDPASIPLVVTDPPYGGILARDWDKTWTEEHQDILADILEYVLTPGGTAYVWGGVGTFRNRIFFDWLGSLETTHPTLRIWDVITWAKKRGYGRPNKYLFTREECVMIVKGDAPTTFHVPYLDEPRGYAGWNKKYPAKSALKRRTNVWSDVSDMLRNKIHPAEKPARLAEIMIETSSNPGDTVLDLFAGSGSTGVAASKLHRNAILIENSDCEMYPCD